MNVQSIALNSANVRYNNANDELKKYNISANIAISNGAVSSGDSGEVTLNDTIVAQFNFWNTNNLNVSYMGISTESQCEINQEINDFIEAVVLSVSTNPVNI